MSPTRHLCVFYVSYPREAVYNLNKSSCAQTFTSATTTQKPQLIQNETQVDSCSNPYPPHPHQAAGIQPAGSQLQDGTSQWVFGQIVWRWPPVGITDLILTSSSSMLIRSLEVWSLKWDIKRETKPTESICVFSSRAGGLASKDLHSY